MQRHPAGENHCIHRELVRAEMRIEEMHGEDKRGCQKGFIGMHNSGHIDNPARQKQREEFGEPEHQTGRSDHADAPEDSEIIELLPVCPAPVLGTRTGTDKPFDRTDKLPAVLAVKHHRLRPEEHSLDTLFLPDHTLENVTEMDAEHAQQDHRTDPVDEAGRLKTTHSLR